METTIRDLRKKVLGRTFLNVWTDFRKAIKKPKSFERFKKEIKGKKIRRIWRRGKNIIFDLSHNRSLLIHQKLTGHLLYGKWEFKNGEWKLKTPGPLGDPMNRFLHLIFWLDNDEMMVLSDLRKFAKAELWVTKELKESELFKNLGPEPLEKDFTFERFREVLLKKKGKIKQILMDQDIIAGIGNIYSDEILWQAKIHPLKKIGRLGNKELKRTYGAMRKILQKSIDFGGESISDYRKPSGEKGGFDVLRKAYRREGEKCARCGTVIERLKIGGRSAHYCPRCQKL